MAIGPLALDRVRGIFGQVLAGLGVAHDYGVVHRDVKPQNIFVLPNGHAKVGDFGIARTEHPVDTFVIRWYRAIRFLNSLMFFVSLTSVSHVATKSQKSKKSKKTRTT